MSDFVWYFAYGSNLDPGTFLGRRGMRPTDTRVPWLAAHRLVFDLPIGPRERGVANVRPDPAASLWGVAYRIANQQAGHLDRTEGVPRAYRRGAVTLETAEGPLEGFTYVAPSRDPGRKPSPRYMNLILRGARHHGLPPDYVAALRAIELAHDERTNQLELFER